MKRFLTAAVALALASSAIAADKKIVLIAGKQSHGPGDHEFRAGTLLLKKCLDAVPGIRTEIHFNGWPSSESAFEGADAFLIYSDGGGGHPAIQPERLKLIDALAKKGVGIGCAHYGVEVPKGNPGEALHRWIGGYYEHLYSVNPMWKPEFNTFPNHPVTRGVKPFALVDEWYFNMRWVADTKGITHILAAKPSDDVRDGPYVHPQGPYKHIVEAGGRSETMMWTFERPDGGRGFGFTGGHKHVNWANDNYRKVVLNALLWIAKAEVPANGVESTITPEDITQNLDPKKGDATNISGKWKLDLDINGQTYHPEFTLFHSGPNLIGKYRGGLGEADLIGSVRGDEAKWTFTVERDGQTALVTYTGKVESASKMKGTAKFGDLGEASWTGSK